MDNELVIEIADAVNAAMVPWLPPIPETRERVVREVEEAIRQALASQPQERGETVAWMTDDGRVCSDLTKREAMSAVAQAAYCIPLYTHPTPDSGRVAFLTERVAELEQQLRNKTAALVLTKGLAEQRKDRIAALEVQLAETNKAYRSMVDANRTASERLAESRVREGRMRGALESIHEYWNRDANHDAMYDACLHAIGMSGAALAAEKEQTK